MKKGFYIKVSKRKLNNCIILSSIKRKIKININSSQNWISIEMVDYIALNSSRNNYLMKQLSSLVQPLTMRTVCLERIDWALAATWLTIRDVSFSFWLDFVLIWNNYLDQTFININKSFFVNLWPFYEWMNKKPFSDSMISIVFDSFPSRSP